MKKILLIVSLCFLFQEINAQCTTTNATSCVCADGSLNCLLLPDITASWKGIANGGWTEYPQTGAGTNYNGQGPDDGRLRVTGSTPNIGHGSFTVRGQDANGKEHLFVEVIPFIMWLQQERSPVRMDIPIQSKC